MEQTLQHAKTFRYEVINASAQSKRVLYVLHGYGQLVKYFIRKFQQLPSDLMIVAPEGMHRFYLKGSSGRVGASWMTKEMRETDITDNLSWLNALDKEISSSYPIAQRYLLGFSQGGATAARWEALGTVEFDEMILWACVFPPDLPKDIAARNVKNPIFVIGDQDEFYNTEDQKELIDYYEERGYRTVQYEGKHDIHSETLLEIVRQMN